MAGLRGGGTSVGRPGSGLELVVWWVVVEGSGSRLEAAGGDVVVWQKSGA